MEALRRNITDIVQGAGGHWGVAIEEIGTGERFEWNGSDPFNAVSLIKLPIMAAVFEGAEQRRFRLTDRIDLTDDDRAGGSGVLQHMPSVASLSVRDLVTLMIIQSDNTATNVLIDLVGKERIGSVMSEFEMNGSVFHHKTGLLLARPEGRNTMTANDAAAFFVKLAKGDFLSRYACARMLEILKKQQYDNGLPRDLPPKEPGPVASIPRWELANKTGWVQGVQHDAGILYVRDRAFAVAALSRDATRPIEALNVIAGIGRAIYAYAVEEDEG
ncbi:class A beta-lactamase-related serine hydrolase [Paenibacillus sp. TRM 82003]|nr:class A beta-lactamase-related serine hydrolase [Paenibacillus sp. TRM 82003]